jgi:hypothetical protein
MQKSSLSPSPRPSKLYQQQPHAAQTHNWRVGATNLRPREGGMDLAESWIYKLALKRLISNVEIAIYVLRPRLIRRQSTNHNNAPCCSPAAIDVRLLRYSLVSPFIHLSIVAAAITMVARQNSLHVIRFVDHSEETVWVNQLDSIKLVLNILPDMLASSGGTWYNFFRWRNQWQTYLPPHVDAIWCDAGNKLSNHIVCLGNSAAPSRLGSPWLLGINYSSAPVTKDSLDLAEEEGSKLIKLCVLVVVSI